MNTIQEKMFAEMRAGEIFEQALVAGKEYINHAFDRNVYPTQEAMQNLLHFDETMPTQSDNAVKIIENLNKFGAPATVS
jgi:hypothetical protein